MIRIGDEIKQKYYKTAKAEVKTLKEFISFLAHSTIYFQLAYLLQLAHLLSAIEKS